jgi:Tol biopolymer transport system component
MAPAWTQDGQEIIFSQALPRKGLSRISSHGGKAAPLLEAGQFGHWPSLSSQGDRLAYSEIIYNVDIWRIDLPGSNGKLLSLSPLISSSQADHTPQFSPDGTKVAFMSDRSGIFKIWICDSDGKNPRQLTSLGESHGAGSPSWSPDGRFVAFDCTTNEFSEIFVMSAEGGSPRRLTEGNANSVAPTWSRDGRWIYYGSNSGEEDWQIWKKPAEDGKAIQVTRRGGIEGGESLDGRFIFYTKKFLSNEVWMAPVSGGEESLFLKGVEYRYRALAEAGMYFVTKEDGEYALKFIDFAKRQVSPITRLPKKIHLGDGGFTLSPDARSLLLPLVEQDSADIMLVENFR